MLRITVLEGSDPNKPIKNADGTNMSTIDAIYGSQGAFRQALINGGLADENGNFIGDDIERSRREDEATREALTDDDITAIHEAYFARGHRDEIRDAVSPLDGTEQNELATLDDHDVDTKKEDA